MGLFFGTDGLRGKVNDDLSWQTAYKCGNALGSRYPKSKILIGRDTRGTGALLTLAFSSGAMNAGCDVVDVGVCPTAGVSYLTKALGYDFGVMISASHNAAEFNGIKILDSEGVKLGDKRELELERRFLQEVVVPFNKVGGYSYEPRLVIKYEEFLANSIKTSLKGKTIVLDCSHGAAYKLAPAVFRDNGARIIATYCKPDGENINEKCGSLHIQKLQKYVLKYKADMGFAFDGDSDRVIAVDNNGNVVDGDKIIYMLACDFKQKGMLEPAIVVGTSHTNKGVEKALEKQGIELIRTDIGDKYVSAKLIEKNLLVGGEQSGHILIKNKHVTGDGILVALHIAEICAQNTKTFAEFFDFELFKQTNINVQVADKMRIINSERLNQIKDEEEKLIGEHGRIMIRVSGTEPYIRVMVETDNESLSKTTAERIAGVIRELNKEIEECAE